MHRLLVLNTSLKQVKAEPFGYKDGLALSEYLEDGWSVVSQLPWGSNLVILLEKPETRNGKGSATQLNGAGGGHP